MHPILTMSYLAEGERGRIGHSGDAKRSGNAKALRQLREQGLLTLRNGSVKIHDPNRLRKLAGFQGYLNFRATGPTDTEWGPPKTLTYAREAPH